MLRPLLGALSSSRLANFYSFLGAFFSADPLPLLSPDEAESTCVSVPFIGLTLEWLSSGSCGLRSRLAGFQSPWLSLGKFLTSLTSIS